MDDKTKAIVAHFTIIGWVIAFVINNSNKTPVASFYVRQMLGLLLTTIAISLIAIIPILGWIVYIVGMIALVVFWIMSLVGALAGEERLTPFLGEKFQQWFSGL